jgi:maltooligosyltrehalose trehalohydrolase
MFRWCRELIAFRRNSRDLNDGEPDNVKVEFSEEEKWLKMDRGQTRIVLNLGESPIEIECGGLALRLASGEGVTMVAKTLVVPPSRLAVLTVL